MVHLFASISFPNIDPVLFRLGSLSIRWYGISYGLGFATAYLIMRMLIRRRFLKISSEALADLMSFLTVGVVVGGRAGWWLFYHRSAGASEPWYEPVATWHGGMSFHGGLIGVGLVLTLWSWRSHVPLWNLADAAALVAPMGLFFGRIANFINAELVGRPTQVPWGVVFPGEMFARHPSQLYEALLEGLLLMLVLWVVHRRFRTPDGRIACLFLIVYGLFRFVVEFTREPDEQLGFIAFGWLTMGQLLSAGLTLVGVLLMLMVGKGRVALPWQQSVPA